MSTTAAESATELVALDLIDPPESQHRGPLDPIELGRLVDSLNELGLLQAIGLLRHADDARFTLVWGWRRFTAARVAGWPKIAARIFPPGYDADRARAAENEFRTDLNPIERAAVCRRWLDEGVALPEIARRWRRRVETIEDWLGLLQLPEELRAAVAAGAITAGVARALAGVDFGRYRGELLHEAQRSGATVRVVEAWAAAYAADRERIIANTETVDYIMQRAADYRVKVVCEVCHAEVPIEAIRTIRCCAADYRVLEDALKGGPPSD